MDTNLTSSFQLKKTDLFGNYLVYIIEGFKMKLIG